MLLKHLEKVREKSENYRMLYAVTVSFLFTLLIGGLWAMSFAVPGISNSASASDAVDNVSPMEVVVQQVGNVFDSIKGLTSRSFMGDKYKVKFEDGTLSLSQNDSVTNNVVSTTTSSGITVEADIVDTSLNNGDNPIVPNDSVN